MARSSHEPRRAKRRFRPGPLLLAFVVGALAGAVTTFLLPKEWSDLSVAPPPAALLLLPAFFVYVGLSIVTLTDFVSNDGASPQRLATLWAISVGIVAGVYALALALLAKLVSRVTGRSRRRR